MKKFYTKIIELMINKSNKYIIFDIRVANTDIYAFDKDTGELLWVSAPGGAPQDTIYTNPTIAVINGQRMLICGNADGR